MNKVVMVLLGLIFIILVILGIVIYFVLNHEPNVEKPVISKPDLSGIDTSQSLKDLEIKPEYLTYIYNELGAYKLHNPPVSSDTPKIITDVEGELFYSEVIDNEISTQKGNIDSVDLKFVTTKKAVVDSVNSENVGEVFKETINSGESTFEIVASEKTLLLKGYLDLYEEITGESYI